MNPPLATSRICGTRFCRMLHSAVGPVPLPPTYHATSPAHPKHDRRRAMRSCRVPSRAVPSLAMRQVATHTCQAARPLGLDAQGHVVHAGVDGYRDTK